jgi:hypothetical protein
MQPRAPALARRWKASQPGTGEKNQSDRFCPSELTSHERLPRAYVLGGIISYFELGFGPDKRRSSTTRDPWEVENRAAGPKQPS